LYFKIYLIILVLISKAIFTDEQEISFHDFFQNHNSIILIIDPENGKILDSNPAASKFYGYSKSNFNNKFIHEINTFSDKQIQEERKLAEKEERNFFLFRHKLANGDIRMVEVHSTPYDLNGKKVLLSIINDITNQRLSEKDLWYYQKRLEESVDEKTQEIQNAKDSQLSILFVVILLQGAFIFSLYRLNQKNINLKRETEVKSTRIISLQKLITEISTDFISINLDQKDIKINLMLEKIGKFFNIDRTVLLEFDSEFTHIKIGYEWCSDEIPFKLAEIQKFSWKSFHWLRTEILKNQPCYIKSFNDFPESAELEKILFKENRMESFLCIPIFNKDFIFLGFLGLVSIKEQKVWNDVEINFLKLLSSIFSNLENKLNFEKDLTVAKRLSEEANLAKSSFLANMSHEIRTPLNGVLGFTDLLGSTELQQIQKTYLNNIKVSGNTLLDTINDILDFSKIEAGKLVLYPTSISLLNLLEQACDVVIIMVSNKKLELILNISPELPRNVLADSTRLKQILLNLLGNAVKFTEHGLIELKVEYTKINDHEGSFHFSILDTGIGIREEEKSKLFEAFVQADSSTTRRFGGTGLGLKISEHLVKKMGGEIIVESTFGEGSIFSFQINLPILDFIPSLSVDIQPYKKAIIVDDNKQASIALKRILNFWKIETIVFSNHIDAISQIINDSNVQLIFCNHLLAEEDGFTTMRRIQDHLQSNGNKAEFFLMHRFIHKVDESSFYKNLSKPIKFSLLQDFLFSVQHLELQGGENYSQSNLDPLQHETKQTFLIVDDNVLNLQLAKRIIQKLLPKSIILEAKNGAEALEIFIQNNPDFIIMDIQMPVMDGWEATEMIRMIEKEQNLTKSTIIALTADAISSEKEKSKKIGMDGYISKPIDILNFRKILEKFTKLQ
jgi:PAS domain S-box-containing protein